jgi:hypothetical protein
MILETRALGDYDSVLFPPSHGRTQNGSIIHTLFLGGGLKFQTVTGREGFPPPPHGAVMVQPGYFLLLTCPKRLMPERNFVPHILTNMRKAQSEVRTRQR